MNGLLHNIGPWLLGFLCCIWPLMFHLGLVYVPRWLSRMAERMPDND